MRKGIERRPFSSVAFSAGEAQDVNNKSIELDTDAYLLGIVIQLVGTISCATNAGSAAGLYGLGAINLLKNIRLYGDGKVKYLENLNLRNLARRQTLFQGVSAYPSNGGLTVATHAVIASVFVPFYPQNFPQFGQHPEKAKFGLPAFKHDRLTFRFDEAMLRDAVTEHASGTAITEALTTRVIGIYDNDADQGVMRHQVRYSGDSLAIASTGTGQKLDLRGDYQLRSLHIDCIDNTIASDAAIGNLDLTIKRSGQLIKPFSADWEHLQYDQDRLSGVAHIAGGLCLMLDDEGDGRGVEDLGGASYAKLEPTITTVTATSLLEVIKEEVHLAQNIVGM